MGQVTEGPEQPEPHDIDRRGVSQVPQEIAQVGPRCEGAVERSTVLRPSQPLEIGQRFGAEGAELFAQFAIFAQEVGHDGGA